MKVRDVLKIASMFVNLEKELVEGLEEGSENVSDTAKQEIEVLLKCLNLTYQEICEYVVLKNKKVLPVENGKILFSDIDDNFKKIISIKDVKTSRKIKYDLGDGYLSVNLNVKQVEIIYSQTPQQLSIDTEEKCIACISEKCFAMGVASEYFYIKSFYSEAEMFYKRFKDLLRYSIKKTSGYIPKRRWK